jgi:hypothetical protein
MKEVKKKISLFTEYTDGTIEMTEYGLKKMGPAFAKIGVDITTIQTKEEYEACVDKVALSALDDEE